MQWLACMVSLFCWLFRQIREAYRYRSFAGTVQGPVLHVCQAPQTENKDGFGWQVYTKIFKSFCSKHNITHELSAPYNPKSNGLAEAGVKSVKNILRKSQHSGSDPDTMLYE